MAKPKKFKREERKGKSRRDYVDKEEFYNELVLYRKQVNHAKENNLPEPQPSDRIGKMIMLIVNRVLTSHRFSGYTDLWKDEMRSEAIYSACRSIKNFDPEVSKNPFAYFTTAVYYVFYNVIKREKKEALLRLNHSREDKEDYVSTGADGFQYRVPEQVHTKIDGIGQDWEDDEMLEEPREKKKRKAKQKKGGQFHPSCY